MPTRTESEKFIIAGPCAVESRDQTLLSAQAMKERGVFNIRLCLWKPRTKPGFDGIGESGIPWLKEVSELGVNVAIELTTPKQAEVIVKNLLVENEATKLIVWIGARNQNHFNQRDIVRVVNDPRVSLIIKNPPWGDLNHWEGIIDHVVGTGFPQDRIIVCHRGFYPYKIPNPQGFRNIPDWEMADKVKRNTGLPMIIDPSHIGGSVDNVFKVTQQALEMNFDGFMVEVHQSPGKALTDNGQQLNLNQFDQLLKMIRNIKH